MHRNFAWLMLGIAPWASAELVSLNDDELQQIKGQAINRAPVVQPRESNLENLTPSMDQPLNTSQPKSAKAGISLDIHLNMTIDEIRWVDEDGAGPNGTAGSLTLSNIRIGG